MRYELAKALRKRFTLRLRRVLPSFRERKARSGVRGVHLYEWRAGHHLTCYVALVVDPGRDRFTVELAWSAQHHFPAQLRQHAPDDEPPHAGAGRFHLRALWQRYRTEPWWSLVPKSPYELELDRALLSPELPEERKVAMLEEHELRLAPALADRPDYAQGEGLTDALARIEPALDDVMARLEKFAAPYFKRRSRTS